MKIIIWNTKGTVAAWHWLREEDSDVWLVQECNPSVAQLRQENVVWGNTEEKSTVAIVAPGFEIEKFDWISALRDEDLKRLGKDLERTPKYRGRFVGAKAVISEQAWIFFSYHAFPIELEEKQII